MTSRNTFKTRQRTKTRCLLFLAAGILVFALLSGGRAALPVFAQLLKEDFPLLEDRIVEKINRTRAKKADALSTQAMRHMREGNPKAAARLLRQALEVSPNYSKAYTLLAQIHLIRGEDDEAWKVLEQSGRYPTKSDFIYAFLEGYTSRTSRRKEHTRIYLAPFKDDKECAVSLSFDDGFSTIFTEILPVFDKYGFKASLFINPGVIPDEPVAGQVWRGSWAYWRDARKRGFEIGSHSLTHRDLTKVPPGVLEEEIRESRRLIEEKVGGPAVSFAFPFDRANSRVIKKVRQYYEAVRDHDVLKETYPRVFLPVFGGEHFSLKTAVDITRLAIQKNLWLIPELHALKMEDMPAFKPVTVQFIEDYLAFLRERESSVWVDTFINVFRYLRTKKDVSLDVIEETEDSVVFALWGPPEGGWAGEPLTVVIQERIPSFKNIRAVYGDGTPLASPDVRGSKVLLSVIPDGRRVKVSWKKEKREDRQ